MNKNGKNVLEELKNRDKNGKFIGYSDDICEYDIYNITKGLKRYKQLIMLLYLHFGDTGKSVGLNEFTSRVNTTFNPNYVEPYEDDEGYLKVTLDYLAPLLKEGKLQVRIIECFHNKKSLGKFLSCVKTPGLRKKCIAALQGREIENLKEKQIIESRQIYNIKECIGIYYDYELSEIDFFREDITNILFTYFETQYDRKGYEMYGIGFKVPTGYWEMVDVPKEKKSDRVAKYY